MGTIPFRFVNSHSHPGALMTHALRLGPPRAAVLFLLALLSGCGSPMDAPTASSSLSVISNAAGTPRIERVRGQKAHPYFPIVPGAFSDYRVTLIGEAPRYLRVTTGAPELFFGRMATPLIYSAIPGLTPDTVFVGLRQYFSISPLGDLWFHGASNGGVMAHSEPPVRQLLAAPNPGEAWSDTVLFESFLPGMVLFVRDSYRYEWTLSETARLVLPGGTFRAVRARSLVYDGPPLPDAPALLAGSVNGTAGVLERLGVQMKPGPIEIFKGFWFARHVGIVARDWPFGEGPENANVRTVELMGRGTGPVPLPPLPPGTG